MKKIFLIKQVMLIGVMVMVWGEVAGQKSTWRNTAANLLNNMVEADMETIRKNGNLVSNTTFTKLVKNDFSLLTTGSDNNTQVGKYAALSIDKDEQTFSFAPITLIRDNPFKHIISINFQGKTNSNGIFNLKNRKQIKCNLNWTFLIDEGYTSKNKPDTTKYKQMYQEIANDLIEKIADTTILNQIENGHLQKEKGLKKTYRKEVEKYETIVTSDKWKVKRLFWTKVDIGYSGDILNIIDTLNHPSSIHKPISKTVGSISVAAAANYFKGWSSGWSLYINAKISGNTKTSLSEITDSKEWNKIQFAGIGNDSIYYNLENKDVYWVDENQFHKRFMFDYSLQALLFFPTFKDNLLGIDINYQSKGFIRPQTQTFRSSKNTISLGVMFPLKDKSGTTTINIEPFYQTIWYNNYDSGKKENLWGIKFGVPLNQLF